MYCNTHDSLIDLIAQIENSRNDPSRHLPAQS